MRCGVCGGLVETLGRLGRVLWGRCRNCGLDQAVGDPDWEDDDLREVG